MQKDVVISVRDLKKDFKIYFDKGNSMKEKLLFWKRNRYAKKEVLKGVSFDIHAGEAIGLVGRNGCGKSTTLKLLTKIIYPTSGSLEIKGRVSSLLELGAGFHPDMSGRENIYTNASIFGLTKQEIEERIDDIIQFSELGSAIDNPVRTYSSGMYMRLAFSVAINVKANILLIDEILAVGDVSFQKKCFDRLKQIKNAGTTIVIVSHALGQIEEICDRSIWIEEGHIRMEGIPKNVHEAYQKYMEEERDANDTNSLTPDPTETNYFQGRKVLRFGRRKFKFRDASGLFKETLEPEHVFAFGESIVFRGYFENKTEFHRFYFGFRIYNANNELCFGSNTVHLMHGEMFSVDGKKYVEIKFKETKLLPGNYFLDIDAMSEDGQLQDSIHEAFFFEIRGETVKTGVLDIAVEMNIG